MKKFIFFSCSLLIASSSCLPTTNPFSKIIITSKYARCTKLSADFFLSYTDNVLVKLANGSTLTTDQLELEGKPDSSSTTTSETKNQNLLAGCKRITAINNVYINDGLRTLRANRMDFLPEQKICTLTGNVTIEQKKVTAKDIPLVVHAQLARYNLETNTLELDGNNESLVSTVIELGKNPDVATYSTNKKRQKK